MVRSASSFCKILLKHKCSNGSVCWGTALQLHLSGHRIPKDAQKPPSPPASGSWGEVSIIATQVHTTHSNQSLQGLSRTGATHSKHRVLLQFSILTFREQKKMEKVFQKGFSVIRWNDLYSADSRASLQWRQHLIHASSWDRSLGFITDKTDTCLIDGASFAETESHKSVVRNEGCSAEIS